MSENAVSIFDKEAWAALSNDEKYDRIISMAQEAVAPLVKSKHELYQRVEWHRQRDRRVPDDIYEAIRSTEEMIQRVSKPYTDALNFLPPRAMVKILSAAPPSTPETPLKGSEND